MKGNHKWYKLSKVPLAQAMKFRTPRGDGLKLFRCLEVDAAIDIYDDKIEEGSEVGFCAFDSEPGELKVKRGDDGLYFKGHAGLKVGVAGTGSAL